MRKSPVLILCILVMSLTMKGQNTQADSLLATATQIGEYIFLQNHDTSYIKSYGDRLSLKVSALNKYNDFKLSDRSTRESISYHPDLGVNFGLGLTYKSLALDLSTSLGVQQKDISSSTYRDIQIRILTSRHYLRLRYQYYFGYKVHQLSGIDPGQLEDLETRLDIRTMQFGVQYLYAFNYGKFSLKAPFVMNERQRKSAGSMVMGINFHMYSLDADSSLIPRQEGTDIHTFSEMNMAALTLQGGYIYSFVINGRFFITLGAIPGIGFKSGDYNSGNRTPFDHVWAFSGKTMNAIGYNGQRFFTGLQLIYNAHYLPLNKEVSSRITEGRASLYLGYRFK